MGNLRFKINKSLEAKGGVPLDTGIIGVITPKISETKIGEYSITATIDYYYSEDSYSLGKQNINQFTSGILPSTFSKPGLDQDALDGINEHYLGFLENIKRLVIEELEKDLDVPKGTIKSILETSSDDTPTTN